MKNLRTIGDIDIPADREILLKIVRELFPRGTPRQSFPQKIEDNGEHFSLRELQLAVGRLSSGKAPGPDGVPNEILKLVACEKPELLLHMYNRCLAEAHFQEYGSDRGWYLYQSQVRQTPAIPLSGDHLECWIVQESYMSK